MSTAAYGVSKGAVVMNEEQRTLRPELQELVRDLMALKQMHRDGIMTHHSQRELVKKLSPQDLAAVARAVCELEKRSQPIFNRPQITK